jgi:hypothetical protein
MMISSWFISLLPGNNGLWAKSSPRIQPADHMSIAVVWVFEFKRSSGLRYHKVTKKVETMELITFKIKKAESAQHIFDYGRMQRSPIHIFFVAIVVVWLPGL